MDKKQEKQSTSHPFGFLWTAKEYVRHIFSGTESFLVPGMALKGGAALLAWGAFAGLSYIAALPVVLYTGAIIGAALVAGVATYGVFSGTARLWRSIKRVHITVNGKKRYLMEQNNVYPPKPVDRGFVARKTYAMATHLRKKRLKIVNKIKNSYYWNMVRQSPATQKVKAKCAPTLQKIRQTQGFQKTRNLVQDKEPAFHTMAATGAAFTILGAVVIVAEIAALPILGATLAVTAGAGLVAWGGFALYSIGRNLITPKNKDTEKDTKATPQKTGPKPANDAANPATSSHLTQKNKLSSGFEKTVAREQDNNKEQPAPKQAQKQTPKNKNNNQNKKNAR